MKAARRRSLQQTADVFHVMAATIASWTQRVDEEGSDALEQVFSAEDKIIANGASNAGYHYMGSAKIMAQIGKAFAEAVDQINASAE